jgi:hypothetical protein
MEEERTRDLQEREALENEKARIRRENAKVITFNFFFFLFMVLLGYSSANTPTKS